jgi:hypothetical protein
MDNIRPYKTKSEIAEEYRNGEHEELVALN